MEDIGARLRAEVDALVAQMGIDVDADYAAFMERYNALSVDERASAAWVADLLAETQGTPVDLEKYDFGYFNQTTGEGGAIIDGEAADRD